MNVCTKGLIPDDILNCRCVQLPPCCMGKLLFLGVFSLGYSNSLCLMSPQNRCKHPRVINLGRSKKTGCHNKLDPGCDTTVSAFKEYGVTAFKLKQIQGW